MANFEYKNIDEIVKDDFPKRGITLNLEELSLLQKQLIVPEFDRGHKSDITGENDFKVELHTFTRNLAYVTSSYDIDTYSVIPGQENPLIQFQVHKDVGEYRLPTTDYKVVYNLHRNMIGGNGTDRNLFISEVSDDRTELRLTLVNQDNDLAKKELAKFVLENIKPKTFVPPIALNFGENKIVDVINVTSDGDPNSFFVKLYEPLPADLNTYFVCWVVVRLMKPYIDSVQVIEESLTPDKNYISGPNFEVDYDYWITSETGYKSWTEILSENVQTSEQLINKYISSSDGPVELNVDFSEFGNFVYYSSARDRVDNFIYKMELLEFYRNEIDRIEAITGSTTTNRVKVELLRDRLISGFDPFERYLYYESTGSFNYTYQVSASVVPYPKIELDVSASDYHISTKEGKFNFYPSSSNEVEAWVTDIQEKASDYDVENIYLLADALPDHIREDDDNEQVETFVNMLGQHFDVMFLYTDHILKKNLREEHPRDGLTQDLIYDATRNMGWTLSHGTSAKDLWEYALGVSGSTEPIWTGKTTVDRYLSKSYAERTKEVWRRILNNLPYLYKTKGTSRAIKALLAAYGIPETLITIREFGGPDNADLGITPRADWQKQTYFLAYDSGSPYVSVPWEKVNGTGGYQYPDTLTFRWEMEPASTYDYTGDSIQTVLQKDFGGSRTDWFVTIERTGSDAEKGNIAFHIGNGTTYVSASIEDEYLFDNVPLNIMIRRSVSNDSTSTDLQYDFFLKTNKYGKVAVNRSASVVVSGSSDPNTQRAWVSPGTLYIGSGSNTITSNPMTGSIFELRYWSSILNESSFNNHVLGARAYNGNTPTSSFYDLQAQFKFWQYFDPAVTSSIISTHPDQTKTSFETSSKVATLVGFTTSSFESKVETYTMEVATVGNNTPFAEKVRIDSGSLLGGLSPTESTEVSAFDTFSVDSNKLMVAFSPQSVINEDIYEAIGNVSIDNYFGEYSSLDADEYPRLKWFAREYWQKYANKNDFTAYIKLVSIFDFSVFDQIRQTLPARANEIVGVVVEPNILERSKVRAIKNIGGVAPNEVTLTTTELSSSRAESTGTVTSKKTTIRIGFDDEESDATEYSGEYDIQIETLGDRDVNVTGDRDIVLVTTGSKNTHKTVISGSRVTKPNLSPVYSPYRTTITTSTSSFDSQYTSYTASVISKASGDVAAVNNTIFDPAVIDTEWSCSFERTNIIRSNGTWITSSNDNLKATALFNTIQSYRGDSYYQAYVFYYSSSRDIAEKNYASSSFVTGSYTAPTSLPRGIRNHRYDGCKLTGAGVNVDTRNTPDGKPVVERYFVSSDTITTDQNFDTSTGGNISAE